jgi:hypothetical protein
MAFDRYGVSHGEQCRQCTVVESDAGSGEDVGGGTTHDLPIYET